MARWYDLRWALYAPIYDLFIRALTRAARRKSIESLNLQPGQTVLVVGCGTGLDFPHIPVHAQVTAIDYTPAMVARARAAARRAGYSSMTLMQADAHQLPFADAAFDAVVLHLIVAVADHPEQVIKEALRVLKPGGRIAIFDKGVDGKASPARKFLNLVTKPLATDINIQLGHLVNQAGGAVLGSRRVLGGLFYLITAGHNK